MNKVFNRPVGRAKNTLYYLLKSKTQPRKGVPVYDI